MSLTQIITLNEKIVAAAKETRRRHSEVVATLNKGGKPTGSSIVFQNIAAAKQGEVLLYEVVARSNPVQINAVIEYYRARFKDFFACSDFLLTEGDTLATEKYDSKVLQIIHDHRDRFISKKLRFFSLMHELNKFKDGSAWSQLAASCSEFNEFFIEVDRLYESFLENLDKAGLLKQFTEFSITNVLRKPSSLNNETGKTLTTRYNTSEICPISRTDSKVILKSEIFPYGWITDCCKPFSEIIDHRCQSSIGVNDMELISLSNKLFNLSGRFEHSFANDQTPKPRLLEIQKSNGDLILAQIEFCKQMDGLSHCGAVEPSATTVTGTKNDIDEINRKIEKVNEAVNVVAKNNFNLKSQNEELRNLFKRSLFDFALTVKPEDFHAFIYIIAYGDRAKAAKALGIDDKHERRFYESVNSWKQRGREYEIMYDVIETRKREMLKEPIPLDVYLDPETAANPKTLREILAKTKNGVLDQRDYPMILQEVFHVLKKMNAQNWEAIRKELATNLKEEIAQ